MHCNENAYYSRKLHTIIEFIELESHKIDSKSPMDSEIYYVEQH